jgi:chorismate mutase
MGPSQAQWRVASPRPASHKAPRGKAAAVPTKPGLESIRERIDGVDAQLHALINERARLAQQVGISKHASGHTVDFYRPEREAQVLRMALERNRNERGRCATRRSCGCSARSCRPASRSRNR